MIDGVSEELRRLFDLARSGASNGEEEQGIVSKSK